MATPEDISTRVRNDVTSATSCAGPVTRRTLPPAGRYGVALGGLCIAVALAVALERTWPSLPPELLLAGAVLVGALVGGFGPGALALVLSIAACAYFLLPPVDSISVDVAAMPRLTMFAVTSALLAVLGGAHQRTLEGLRRSRDGLAAQIDDFELAEDSLRPLVDTIPTLVWSASPDGMAEFFSRPWLRFTGLSAEEALGAGWTSALHPDDRGRVIETWLAMAASQEPGELEARLRRADGVYRWFVFRATPFRDHAGTIVKWFGTNTDIDDLKSAEAALLTLIESIPGMIAAANADGEQDYVNRRLLDFAGIQPGESGGSGWLETVHPEERSAIAEEWRRSAASGRPFDVMHRMRRFDGVYRWVHSRAEAIRAEDGAILRWYALIDDVHDRKAAEDALGTSQAALAHVGRVTIMGELSASIAHEVNQPLAAIVNNAGACLALLPEDPTNGDETRAALRDIIDDAQRASAIVSRVRQLARKAPLERTPLRLQDVVTDVLALARYESSARRATIHCELHDELPLVLGDRIQLQQVLLNLVLNGMEAMDTVDDSQRVLAIRVRHDTSDGQSSVLLSVEDAGTGFAAADGDRLFEAFYSTKSHGMGMGLAISRSIVEAHGGRLWAEVNQGAGAILLMSLPAHEDGRA